MSSQTSPNEPPTLDEKWRTAYTCLLAYRDAHAGNANPPQRATDPQTGFAIGKWVTNQRTAHQQGRLDPDKHSLLVQAGVTFDRDQVAALGMASPNRANTYSTKRATTCQRVLAELHALQDAGVDVNTVGRHYGTTTFASLGRAVRDIQHDHTSGALPARHRSRTGSNGLVFVSGPQARAMHVHDTTLERTLTCLGHYRAARPGAQRTAGHPGQLPVPELRHMAVLRNQQTATQSPAGADGQP